MAEVLTNPTETFEALMREGVRLHSLGEHRAARELRGQAVVAAEQFGDDSVQMMRALRDLMASLSIVSPNGELITELGSKILPAMIEHGSENDIPPRELAATSGRLARWLFDRELSGRRLDGITAVQYYELEQQLLADNAAAMQYRGMAVYDQYAVNDAAGHAAALGRAGGEYSKYPLYRWLMTARAFGLAAMSESPHISNSNPNLTLARRWATVKRAEDGSIERVLPGPKARHLGKAALALASNAVRPISRTRADRLARKIVR